MVTAQRAGAEVGMSEVVLLFAPACLVAIVGTLELNRIGWHVSRVMLGVVIVIVIRVVELEIAWRSTNYKRTTAWTVHQHRDRILGRFSYPAGRVLGPVGWIVHRRGRNPTVSTFLVLALPIPQRAGDFFKGLSLPLLC